MGFLDLLSHLADTVRPSEEVDPEVERAARELAASAASDDLSAAELVESGVHTDQSVIEHLDDGERPEYVLHGGELLVSDEDGGLSRNHPSGEMRVVVTDRRVVFVQGGRISDTVVEVPSGDIVSAYVDEEGRRDYLIVETHYDPAEEETDRDAPGRGGLLGRGETEEIRTTFFADVSLEPNPENVSGSIEYLRAHAPEVGK